MTIRVATVDGQSDEALADLDARVLDGELSDVFQVLSRDLAHWRSFDAGDGLLRNLLQPLDEALQETGAAGEIPEDVLALSRRDGKTWAAPIGLHRHNGMFINKSVMADLGVTPPRSLVEFVELCEDIQASNSGKSEAQMIYPVANTAQGWALELVFKSVLAAAAEQVEPGSGGDYIVAFFGGLKSVDDQEFRIAVEFMNAYFSCSNVPPPVYSYTCQGGRADGGYCLEDKDCGGGTCVTTACVGGDDDGASCADVGDCGGDGAHCAPNYHHEWDYEWTDAAALLRDERALMFVHGDWVQGEYNAVGFADYDIVPAWGTDNVFIYNVDAFATFVDAHQPNNAMAFIRTALSREGQAAFSIQKGSTPPRRDVALDGFSVAAKAVVDHYRSATHLQDAESHEGWDPSNLLLDLWRARHRDGYAATGARYDADITDFIEQCRAQYDDLRVNKGLSL